MRKQIEGLENVGKTMQGMETNVKHEECRPNTKNVGKNNVAAMYAKAMHDDCSILQVQVKARLEKC